MVSIERLADVVIEDSLTYGHAHMVCESVDQAISLLKRLHERIPPCHSEKWREMYPTEKRHLAADIVREKEVNVYSVRFIGASNEESVVPVRVRVPIRGVRWRADVRSRGKKRKRRANSKK